MTFDERFLARVEAKKEMLRARRYEAFIVPDFDPQQVEYVDEQGKEVANLLTAQNMPWDTRVMGYRARTQGFSMLGRHLVGGWSLSVERSWIDPAGGFKDVGTLLMPDGRVRGFTLSMISPIDTAPEGRSIHESSLSIVESQAALSDLAGFVARNELLAALVP